MFWLLVSIKNVEIVCSIILNFSFIVFSGQQKDFHALFGWNRGREISGCAQLRGRVATRRTSIQSLGGSDCQKFGKRVRLNYALIIRTKARGSSILVLVGGPRSTFYPRLNNAQCSHIAQAAKQCSKLILRYPPGYM